jgi:hypothetical protein
MDVLCDCRPVPLGGPDVMNGCEEEGSGIGREEWQDEGDMLAQLSGKWRSDQIKGEKGSDAFDIVSWPLDVAGFVFWFG